MGFFMDFPKQQNREFISGIRERNYDFRELPNRVSCRRVSLRKMSSSRESLFAEQANLSRGSWQFRLSKVMAPWMLPRT